MKLPLQAACQLLCTRSNLFLSLFQNKLTPNSNRSLCQMNILSDWLNIALFFVNIGLGVFQLNEQLAFWLGRRPLREQGKVLDRACRFQNKQLYFLAPVFFGQ